MSSIRKLFDRTPPSLLANGDRMGQADFHRRYEMCPEQVRFELVGGTVYQTPPTTYTHGRYSAFLCFVLGQYRRFTTTAGIEALPHVTVILGEESEPQPDLTLLIAAEFGGRSSVNADDYVTGPPELLIEIAYSTRSLDMHQKRYDYEHSGVLEYLVLCIEEQELHWFRLVAGSLIKPNRRGIYCSKVFPGLWIHGPSLLAMDTPYTETVLRQGLDSRAHAAFVKCLEKARKCKK
jgi:Uma2 family endonuclease